MSILLLESIHPDARALLEVSYTVNDGTPELPQPSHIDLTQVEGIVTRGRGRINRHFLSQCPNLRVVARCGAGLDNIDTITAQESGISVIYAPGMTTHAVAEHALMFMLACARSLRKLARDVESGHWSVRAGYQGAELRGKTVGILGMGAIGQRVAALADAFGMQTIYWNRSPIPIPYNNVSRSDVFALSDFVSLHTALTPDTHGSIGQTELALMKPSAYLINTARGALVDEQALLEALNEGNLAGYAADLLTEDPPPKDHPLLHHPQTLITPHTAVLTDRTYRDICYSTARNVVALLQGDAPEPRSVYRSP